MGVGGDVGGGFSDAENGESGCDGVVKVMMDLCPLVVVSLVVVSFKKPFEPQAMMKSLWMPPPFSWLAKAPKRMSPVMRICGIVGKFYATYGRFGKDENSDTFPKSVHLNDKQGMLACTL